MLAVDKGAAIAFSSYSSNRLAGNSNLTFDRGDATSDPASEAGVDEAAILSLRPFILALGVFFRASTN
jgi:TctA family transporter